MASCGMLGRGENDGCRVLNWVTRYVVVLYRSAFVLVEVVGFGGLGRKERKVEIMSSVDRSVRHGAFEVFMRCLAGDVQQAAGCTVELPVVSIVNDANPTTQSANRCIVHVPVPFLTPVICPGIKSGAGYLGLM